MESPVWMLGLAILCYWLNYVNYLTKPKCILPMLSLLAHGFEIINLSHGNENM